MQIKNKVKKSGLIQLNLEDWIDESKIRAYDISENLFQGLVLKEKDFRQFVKQNDWSTYQDAIVYIHDSSNSIIPSWSYMLLTLALQPYADSIYFSNKEGLKEKIILTKISNLDLELYRDSKVVIKGCSRFELTNDVYIQLTRCLAPVVSSLMFGEPCSTVPLYKKAKKR